MNNLTTQQIREILDGAPKSSQFVDYPFGKLVFIRIRNGMTEMQAYGKWIQTELNWPFTVKFRSLNDLRRIVELEDKQEKFLNVIKAVAHIGVDFGFGNYELEVKYIDMARELYPEEPNPPEQVK